MSYSLEVLVHGKAATKYYHEGLFYVEGRKGTEYVLRFQNNTGERVLAVMSVDGLSIMDGEEASYESNGYIVGPYSAISVPGWRLDNDSVAKFKFGGSGAAYASKKGKGLNLGVLGCAVFKEKKMSFPNWKPTVMTNGEVQNTGPIWLRDYNLTGRNVTEHVFSCTDTTVSDSITCFNADSAGPVPVCAVGGGATSSSHAYRTAVKQELGTEFGGETSCRVREIEFFKEDLPVEVIDIHYDSRAGLERRGIQFDKVIYVPCSFPKAPKRSSGCKPPPGWQR